MNLVRSLTTEGKIFSWHGRIGRQQYFWRIIKCVIFTFLSFLLLFLSMLYFLPINKMLEEAHKGNLTVTQEPLLALNFIGFIFVLVSGIYYIVNTVKRTHDLNKSGKFIFMIWALGILKLTVVTFIMLILGPEAASNLLSKSSSFSSIITPINKLIGLFLSISSLYLFFKKGTVGPNFYGPDPLAKAEMQTNLSKSAPHSPKSH